MDWTPAERIHMELLEKWRHAHNLVGPGPVDPHFIDAAGAVEGLCATGRWVDVGSGAGFPGIALASRWPEASVVLVESRQKRVAFLRQVVAQAGLANVEIVHGRIEDVAPGFDGFISRAWAPPDRALPVARRLLVPGGRAVLLLAGDAEKVAPDGWRLLEHHRYPVPDGWRTRVVLSGGTS